jgi:uncharacterized protein YndB with AHSA1/START domain
MDNISMERSIWINASRQKVWAAITEPEHIPQWFLPTTFAMPMKRDQHGNLCMSFGPMETEIARFEVTEPLRQVTSIGLPDNLIGVTYRLDDDNGGTRVTVTMRGFESLPAEARQDRLQVSSTGWAQALENLKAYVEGTERPYPQSDVAPLFGYWREPKEKIAVERSIWINASRERVWQAITDPVQVEKWFSPGTPWRLSALEPGGKLSVYNAETDTHSYTQIIDVVEPPHRLVTHSAPPEIPHVTDYTLEEEDGGTRLTLVYTGYELEAAETRRQNMEQNTFGFGMMLANLKASVEGKSLPFPGGF